MTYIVESFWNIKRPIRMFSENISVSWFLPPFGCLWTPIKLKGAGHTPHSILFASKDGLIGYLCMLDPKLKSIVNAAASTLDVGIPNIKRQLAKQILEGSVTEPLDFFSAGKEFMVKHVWEEGKKIASSKAQEKLRANRINVPNEVYTNFPILNMENVISGNSKLGKIEADIKNRLGSKYYKSTLTPTKDMVEAAYGWMGEFKTEMMSRDEEEVISVCPYAVIDSRIQKLYRIFGIIENRDVYQVHPERVLRLIRQDKSFPRYLRAERVFELVTQPAVIQNPEMIYHILVAIGLEANVSSRLMRELVLSGDTYKMLTESIILSTNDNIIGQLNLNRINYERFVEMSRTANRILDATLSVLGLGYVIYRYLVTGKMYKIRFTLTDQSRATMMAKFTGKKMYLALKSLGIYRWDVPIEQ